MKHVREMGISGSQDLNVYKDVGNDEVCAVAIDTAF